MSGLMVPIPHFDPVAQNKNLGSNPAKYNTKALFCRHY